MDQEVRQPPRGEVETAMFDGPRRRRVVDNWRTTSNPPASWWRRVVSILTDNHEHPVDPSTLETRNVFPGSDPPGV